jgi:hypothetical protein
MKADALLDLIAAHRKIHGNFDVCVLDPKVPLGEGQSQWTPDFWPLIQPHQTADGQPITLALLIPHPKEATMELDGRMVNMITKEPVDG